MPNKLDQHSSGFVWKDLLKMKTHPGCGWQQPIRLSPECNKGETEEEGCICFFRGTPGCAFTFSVLSFPLWKILQLVEEIPQLSIKDFRVRVMYSKGHHHEPSSLTESFRSSVNSPFACFHTWVCRAAFVSQTHKFIHVCISCIKICFSSIIDDTDCGSGSWSRETEL